MRTAQLLGDAFAGDLEGFGGTHLLDGASGPACRDELGLPRVTDRLLDGRPNLDDAHLRFRRHDGTSVARPAPSSMQASNRLRRAPRENTGPELALRRVLHRRGLRYFVGRAPLGAASRAKADVVFPRARVAVFVDGCFWHGCPQHGTWPKANAAWWRAKIEGNIARDRRADEQLRAAGWAVVRVWEHENVTEAADRVERRVREGQALRAKSPSRASNP